MPYHRFGSHCSLTYRGRLSPYRSTRSSTTRGTYVASWVATYKFGANDGRGGLHSSSAWMTREQAYYWTITSTIMLKIIFNVMISTKTSKCSPENVNKPKIETVISLNKKQQAHISNHANSDDLKPNLCFYFINEKLIRKLMLILKLEQNHQAMINPQLMLLEILPFALYWRSAIPGHFDPRLRWMQTVMLRNVNSRWHVLNETASDTLVIEARAGRDTDF